MIAVFSRPGRDDLTERTIALLDGHGGASTVDDAKVLWWAGLTPPPFVLPAGWAVEWRGRSTGYPVADWIELAGFADGRGGDLHAFEDDVIPCRNLLPYLARRPVEYFTSYFNPWRRPAGQALLLSDRFGFDCSQAVSIPARLVARFASLQAADLVEERRGQDIQMHESLKAWREPCVWGPSLVQHRHGPRSNGQQRKQWLSDPAFVGDDFDALTLADETIAPLPIPPPPPVLRARLDPRERRRA